MKDAALISFKDWVGFALLGALESYVMAAFITP